MAPNDSLLRHRWRSLLILLGGWTLPAVMIGIGIIAIQRGSEQGEPVLTVFVRQLWYYWYFAALCPILYRLQNWAPFTRTTWRRSLLAHVGVALPVIVVVIVLSALVDWVIATPQGQGALERVRQEFTSQQGQFQIIVHAFYYVVAVGVVVIVRLLRQRQREEERAAALDLRTSQLETQVTRARLQALEMQLNPHFLFNALNSIAALVQLKKTDSAYEAIARLGELLRKTLRAGDRHTITLAEELQLLENYLDLERLRFSDRLQTAIQVEDDCHEAAVPVMVLQPLVENAIRHGISRLPEGGLLEIAVRRRERQMILEVRDDGPGLPDGWTLESGAGVGLGNLRDRLQAHFDGDFELNLEPGHPRGTVAQVRFPFHLLVPRDP